MIFTANQNILDKIRVSGALENTIYYVSKYCPFLHSKLLWDFLDIQYFGTVLENFYRLDQGAVSPLEQHKAKSILIYES